MKRFLLSIILICQLLFVNSFASAIEVNKSNLEELNKSDLLDIVYEYKDNYTYILDDNKITVNELLKEDISDYDILYDRFNNTVYLTTISPYSDIILTISIIIAILSTIVIFTLDKKDRGKWLGKVLPIRKVDIISTIICGLLYIFILTSVLYVLISIIVDIII